VEEKLTARAKLIYERDSNSPLFLRVADTYLQSNNPAYAISILEDGLKNFPDHPLALILMGRANVMLNEIEMAEFFFKKSSELLNTNRTYIYYKKEYNLPDKQLSPFDSSRGSVFVNSSEEEIPRVEDLIPDKSQPVEERLSQIANEIMNTCKSQFRCFYEEKDSIGKRYRRMDALGTPFCVTIDHQSKEDNTVTIRHRDSMQQERIPIEKIKDIVLASL